MKDFYIKLIKKLEEQGELFPRDRLEIRKKIGTKQEQIQLNLKCLKKVQSSWTENTPLSPQIQDYLLKIIKAASSDSQHTLEKILPVFYEKCDEDLEDPENIYVCYLKPAVEYLESNINEDFPMDESSYETDKNSDLEYDEWDTPYCACVMWEYQDLSAQDNVRKKRVLEFWEWYIKEAAKLQGITIRTKVKIPVELENFPNVEINTIQDFAEYIEYDFEYINKYEIKNDRQLLIYVCVDKDGAECPKCGVFSSRILGELSGITSVGKLRGWTIDFFVTIYEFRCGNRSCNKRFYPMDKVGLNENIAHFNYLKSLPGMQDKICELFGLD